MTDNDILVLSVIFNIVLVFHNWLMHKRYDRMGELFAKTVHLVGAIADGKAMPQRDNKGEIRIKDLRNETN